MFGGGTPVIMLQRDTGEEVDWGAIDKKGLSTKAEVGEENQDNSGTSVPSLTRKDSWYSGKGEGSPSFQRGRVLGNQ